MNEMKHIKKFNEGVFREFIPPYLHSVIIVSDNTYKIIEVDEPMGGEGTKVLNFLINDELADIEIELGNLLTKWRKREINSDEFYKFLKFYDEWHELCS